MKERSKRIAIAYVPVLHAGYLSFFNEANASVLYLVSDRILGALDDFDYLRRKDALRALPQERMRTFIQTLGVFEEIGLLDEENAKEVQKDSAVLVMPDEDVSRALKTSFFPGNTVEYSSVFLRWHRDNTSEQKAAEAHRLTDPSELAVRMLSRAHKEAEQSADWWRQVGAVLAPLDSEPLTAHNEHNPDEQSPYADGDPRSLAKRGVKPEITTAVHAEGALIGRAARAGIKTEGAKLFVTDFPCPFCARMIAGAGIKELYFSRGYAGLDSADRLRDAGVELYFVPM